MMPVSRRIAEAASPASPSLPEPLRSFNSSTVTIVVATSFAILSALISLVSEPVAGPASTIGQIGLRGSLSGADESRHP